MLEARLFGPLRVEIDGRKVPEIAGLRPRALLAYLLLHPGAHARARLAASFWPDVLDTSARASLRSALHTIRVALDAVGGGVYLEGDRTQVAIAASRERAVDSELFDELVSLGDDPSLERAFALADGVLLADLADDWVLEARDDYRERVARVALTLADRAEADGDLARAADWTRRALSSDRLSEATHRTLMRRLLASGERAQALAAYARCKAVLRAEFGTAPSPETRELAGRMRAGADTSDAPADPSGRARRDDAPLVGRARETASLADAWDRARSGHGGVVLLTGPAGIGKSSLAEALMARAASEGALCATGAPLDLEGGPPLAAWSQAIRDLVGDTALAPPAGISWPSDLARLSPAVETAWEREASPPAATPDLERARLFEATVECVEWLAARRAVLIVFEDVHGLDAAALALLAYVGRRLSGLPVLVVATRRPAAHNQPLAIALDALQRSGAISGEIVLGPLDAQALGEIVSTAAPGLSSEDSSEAVRTSEGNPLLAHVAARALAEGALPEQGLRAWLAAPLARLGESDRLLVDLCAAAGRSLAPGEAAELVGAERLPEALDAGLAADLLAESPDRRIGFRHALLRDACYADLGPGRRAWAHRRLAETLLARRRPVAAEIGRHLLLGGEPERARGFLASAAAQARSLGAVDEAAAYLREAAALAADDPGVAAELWLELATVESWRGNRAAYDEAFERAAALLREDGDPLALAAAYVARGRCLWTTLCYPHDATRANEQALTELAAYAGAAPELHTLALAGMAWSESLLGDAIEAVRLVDSVADLSHGLADDPALAAELAFVRGMAHLRAGQGDRSEQEIDAAVDLALTADRPELAQLSLSVTGAVAASRGDFGRVLEYAERALAVGHHGRHLETQALAAKAYALSRLERHGEAIEVAESASLLSLESGDEARQALAAFDLGSIYLAAGRADAAREQLAAALGAEASTLPRATARLRLAESTLLGGDSEGAERELQRVPFEPVAPADIPTALVPRLERLEGLIAAARGDDAKAVRAFGAAEATWRTMLGQAPDGNLFGATVLDVGRVPVAGLIEPALELGRVLAERALALACAGRADEATEAAAEAAALADELPFDGYRETLARVALLVQPAPKTEV